MTCLQASTSEAQLETEGTAALFYNMLVFYLNVQYPCETIIITSTIIIILLLCYTPKRAVQISSFSRAAALGIFALIPVIRQHFLLDF